MTKHGVEDAGGEGPLSPGIVAACRAVLLGALLASTVGCATPPRDDPIALEAYREANDPLEPFNRAVFRFNDAVDEAIIVPVATIYRDVLPLQMRNAVRNLLRHVQSPIDFANNLLQGDLTGANAVLARAVVNTIAGFGGLGDPAGDLGTAYRPEDFGQTLAVWGIGEGPYLVLPLLGPSNPRDLTGLVVDTLADPLNLWLSNEDYGEIIFARGGLEVLDFRSRNIEFFADLQRTSLDYYASVRSLYRQHRENQIRNGDSPDPAVTPVTGFEEERPLTQPQAVDPEGGNRISQAPVESVRDEIGIVPFAGPPVRRIEHGLIATQSSGEQP